MLDDSLVLDDVELRSSGWGLGSGVWALTDVILRDVLVANESVLAATLLDMERTTVRNSLGAGVYLTHDATARIVRSYSSGIRRSGNMR